MPFLYSMQIARFGLDPPLPPLLTEPQRNPLWQKKPSLQSGPLAVDALSPFLRQRSQTWCCEPFLPSCQSTFPTFHLSTTSLTLFSLSFFIIKEAENTFLPVEGLNPPPDDRKPTPFPISRPLKELPFWLGSPPSFSGTAL